MTHTKAKLEIGALIVEDGSPVIRMAYPDVRNSIIKVASCNTTETLVGYTDNDEEPPVKLGSPFDISFAQRIVECVNGWDELNEENEVNTKFVGKLGVENAMLKVQKAELTEQVEKLQSSLKMAMHELQHLSNNSTTGEIIAKIKQAL